MGRFKSHEKGFAMNNDFNQDYLMHYGIPGMKWGVRRYQNYDGSLKTVNKNDFNSSRHLRAVAVSERLNDLKKDKTRMSRMSERQKKSLEAATKYWNKRASGDESGFNERNFIKRQADVWRSKSLASRARDTAAYSTAISAINVVRNNKVADMGNTIMGENYIKKQGLGTIAVNSVVSTGVNLGLSEITNKVFGHY